MARPKPKPSKGAQPGDMKTTLASEAKAKDQEQSTTGEVKTTDPSFAGGANEIESMSNQPHKKA